MVDRAGNMASVGSAGNEAKKQVGLEPNKPFKMFQKICESSWVDVYLIGQKEVRLDSGQVSKSSPYKVFREPQSHVQGSTNIT